MPIPVIALRGAPAERGAQHGRALRAEIAHCIEIYRRAIPGSEAALRERAVEVDAEVRRGAPELALEMDGIAEGAGVEPWWIRVLNARSELMSSADGCTAVFFPEAGLLAQTWDWIEPLEGLFAVLHIERPDGQRIATVTEPGMVGKIGLNSAGLGCTLNFMFSPGPLDGTPIHVLLRTLLDASDLADARRRIEQRRRGQSGNVIVGHRDGGLDAELAGQDAEIRELGASRFAHTNHHLWRPIPAGPLEENSRARLDRANALCAEQPPGDAKALMRLLSDTRDPKHPICARYQPLLGTRIGTLCTVVMELAAGRMHLRRGPDPDAPFESVSV